jgi:hypothetical protein
MNNGCESSETIALATAVKKNHPLSLAATGTEFQWFYEIAFQ